MTGNELAKAIRAHRGKIQVRGVIGAFDGWFYVSKPELIEYFTNLGDIETGAQLETTPNGDTTIASVF